jgi:hypothetical protein
VRLIELIGHCIIYAGGQSLGSNPRSSHLSTLTVKFLTLSYLTKKINIILNFDKLIQFYELSLRVEFT